MKQVSGKDLVRVVTRGGWQLLRVNGSHHIYGRTGDAVRLSIPVHGNRPLRSGLLRHLMKQAGFSENDL